MSSSDASLAISSGFRAPNLSSTQDFPDLAPSTMKLDLTPTPLAHIIAQKHKLKAKPTPKPTPQPTITSEPIDSSVVSRPSRCTDSRCPVTGYHHKKIYTCGDDSLPTYVKDLTGRADRVWAYGAKHEFNKPQQKLDRFFYMHSGFFYLPLVGMGEDREMVYGPFETSGAMNGWQSYLLEETT